MARRNLFGSNNPMTKEEVYRRPGMIQDERRMTVRGTIDKSLMLFGILLLAAYFAYTSASPGIFTLVGSIGGLISVMVANFKPHTSPVTAPITAIFEGLLVGGVSAYYAMMSGGIIFQAVSLTFAVLFLMLMIYRSGLIKVTEKFKMVVGTAFMAIFVVYMINFALSFFGINMPYLHDSGPIGIGIGLFVIVIASLNLLVNFDSIEKGAEHGAPSYMEWFGGLGVMITLVWIYLEILRLVSILNRD